MNTNDSIATQITNDQLVAKTIANLLDDDELDHELLDILTKNIVKMVPAETAINDAVNAIEALAAKRAEES